jgi:tetratricopeptide (TPR) repeat protein
MRFVEKLMNRKRPLQIRRRAISGICAKPVFVLLLLFLVGAAAAAPRSLGDAHRAYDQRQYETAIEIFREHYKFSPKPGLLFNLGKCFEKLGQYRQAVIHFQRYLKEVPGAKDRPRVEQLLVELRSKELQLRPALTLDSSPKGARVYRDQEFLGETPLILKLAPGLYELQLKLDGHETLILKQKMEAGFDAKRAVILKAIPKECRVEIEGARMGSVLFVDGKSRGPLPLKEPLLLMPGKYDIRLEAPGYLPWRRSQAFLADQRNVLTVKQQFIPPKPVQKKPDLLKPILGFSALGAAVLSEALALVFTVQANEQTVETIAYEDSRNAAIGLHVGAGLAAVAASALITLWILDGKRPPQKKSSASPLGLIRW